MQNVVNGCTMAFNQSLAQWAAKCPDDRMLPMHDGWIAAVAACFGQIKYIDQATMGYRQHGHNSVGAENVRSAGYVMGRLSKIDQLRQAIAGKKMQAKAFDGGFGVRMDTESREFLTEFGRDRSGPLFYWKNRRLIHSLYHLVGFCLLG